MAPSRTWYSDCNVASATTSTSVVTNAQMILFNLKRLLTRAISGTTGASGTAPSSAAWTVMGSANVTTAGMDGVDRWTAYTNIIFAASGNAHSWIVLRSPAGLGGDGPYYLLISGASTNSASAYVTISYSKNPYTGSSNLTDPTSTDSVPIATNAVFYSDTSASTNTMSNICRDANGGFYFVAIHPGFAYPMTFFSVVGLNSVAANDGWKVAATCFAGNGGAALFWPAPTPIAQRTYLNTALATGDLGMYYAGVSTMTSSSISGPDAVTGTYAASPLVVYSTNVGDSGFRGVLPDAYALASGTALGDKTPSTGATEYVSFRGALLPFTATLTV